MLSGSAGADEGTHIQPHNVLFPGTYMAHDILRGQ